MFVLERGDTRAKRGLITLLESRHIEEVGSTRNPKIVFIIDLETTPRRLLRGEWLREFIGNRVIGLSPESVKAT